LVPFAGLAGVIPKSDELLQKQPLLVFMKDVSGSMSSGRQGIVADLTNGIEKFSPRFEAIYVRYDDQVVAQSREEFQSFTLGSVGLHSKAAVYLESILDRERSRDIRVFIFSDGFYSSVAGVPYDGADRLVRTICPQVTSLVWCDVFPWSLCCFESKRRPDKETDLLFHEEYKNFAHIEVCTEELPRGWNCDEVREDERDKMIAKSLYEIASFCYGKPSVRI
jgi:hypothetical protein